MSQATASVASIATRRSVPSTGGLPDAVTLDKVSRYEAHLNRQLLGALNTLERWQAARAGKDVPPPAAGTLVLDHSPAELADAG